ncbi:MAG: hypothetical protein R2794_07525 [Chitinophagales bacterium]
MRCSPLYQPVFTLVIILAFASCERAFEGDLLENTSPETATSIDTIIRFGDDRLESEVTLHWWGDDPDGYITGYEFTFEPFPDDATIWIYTERQDSTFILAPEPGQDSADYVFYIRSIDNIGLRDPSPARLVIPVKNSPPSAQIVPGINNPVRSFPVVKFFWTGIDPDGAENLKEFHIYWNDTTGAPLVIDKSITSGVFQAQDPFAAEPVCDFYPNTSSVASGTISGMVSNAWNTLYIQAVDQSNAVSAFAVSDSVFIKPVHSDVLLVDGYSTTVNEAFYGNAMLNNGISVFDTIQIFQKTGAVYTQQSADNLTQERVFDLFDLIIWFSNDANNSFSLAQKTTDAFFTDGGKMFMSVYISSSFDPLSNFLDFTPIASLVNPVDTTLLLDLGAHLVPQEAGWPELEGSSIIGVVKPINVQIGAQPLYEAELTAKDNITLAFNPWTGNSIVIAKKFDAFGNTNFIVSTLEMHKMNAAMNTDAFFDKVIHDAFGF